jgi:hypothetical protein
MTFSHFNRRLHLYLALALLPWLCLYGASSVPFAHGQYFDRRDAKRGLPNWTLRYEHPLDVPVPDAADPAAMRLFAKRLLDDGGIRATSYGAYRQSPSQLNVYAYSFWQSTQVLYFTDRKAVSAEDRRFRWDQFLTGMHARGGFDQDGVLVNTWSVVVDLVQLGILVWVASGLFMWWELRPHRRWGIATIAAGVVALVVFVVRL